MKKILIADDDDGIRKLIEFKLNKEGYEVVGVAAGNLAKEHLTENHSFDLVIVDYMMPGLTGIEVIVWVRQSSSTPHLPCLLLTAKGQAEDIEAAKKAGATHLMQKPFLPADLAKWVKSTISDDPS